MTDAQHSTDSSSTKTSLEGSNDVGANISQAIATGGEKSSSRNEMTSGEGGADAMDVDKGQDRLV